MLSKFKMKVSALVLLLLSCVVYWLFIPTYVCMDLVYGRGYSADTAPIEFCATKIQEKKSLEILQGFQQALTNSEAQQTIELLQGDNNAKQIGYEKYKQLFLPMLKEFAQFSPYLSFSVGHQTVNVFSQDERKASLIINPDNYRYSAELDIKELNSFLASLSLRKVDKHEVVDYWYLINYFVDNKRQWLVKGNCYLNVKLPTEALNKNEVIDFVESFLDRTASGKLLLKDFKAHNEYQIFVEMLKADPEYRPGWFESKIVKVVTGENSALVVLDTPRGKVVHVVVPAKTGFQFLHFYKKNAIENLYYNGMLKL